MSGGVYHISEFGGQPSLRQHDSGPALRKWIAQVWAAHQDYGQPIGSQLLLDFGPYLIGPDPDTGAGGDLSRLVAVEIRGPGGAPWTDAGEYGTSFVAGAPKMTILRHQDPDGKVNHHGPRIRWVGLSNFHNHANVVGADLADVNNLRLEEVNAVGGGSYYVGMRLRCGPQEGADSAYNVLDQCGFRLTGNGSIGLDLPRGYGIRVRDGQVNMGSNANCGVRIGKLFQSAFFRGMKWNHDGRLVVSEGGNIGFSHFEWEAYSPTKYMGEFRKSTAPDAPNWSGEEIRLRDGSISGKYGHELGLYTGPGTSGLVDGVAWRNLQPGNKWRDESGGGWADGVNFG